MKNYARINDGSVGCRESYLKNAIINRIKGETGRGRGGSVYLWNTWPRILGGSERILSGLSQLTNSSGDFVVLLFLSKGIQDGSIDAEGEEGEFDQFMIEEAIEVNSFGNWTKFWREEKVSIKTDVEIFIRFEYFILPFYDYSFTNV